MAGGTPRYTTSAPYCRRCLACSALAAPPRAGTLHVAGVDNEADCARERACNWKRFAAVVRSTSTGAEKTSVRILCASGGAPSPLSAPHCVQFTISPEPVRAPAHVELCVRWTVLVIRESLSSNAMSLGALLSYMSALIRLTAAKGSRTHSQPSAFAPSDPANSSSAVSAHSAALATRCRRDCFYPGCKQLTRLSQGISQSLRGALQGGARGNMSAEGWSGVRQLILLRTKRKAAEAALSSFMIAAAENENDAARREPAPASTLVLNCFVDIISQQVCRAERIAIAQLHSQGSVQDFHPSIMSIALAEFYHMLLLMQVSFASLCPCLTVADASAGGPAFTSSSVNIVLRSSRACLIRVIHVTLTAEAVQRCMRQTTRMIVAQIGNDVLNPSTAVTEQVCLRRCMLMLQKVQLWLLGFTAPLSHQIHKLQQPCAWLLIEHGDISLVQLQDMAECLFPPQIMKDLSTPAESAAKVSTCFLGSSFEQHVLLALLHPLITLPLDSTVKGATAAAPDARDDGPVASAWCDCSVFVHTLHCMRMSIRKFVQSFNSIGKPSHPQSLDFLKFVHDLQVSTLPEHALMSLSRRAGASAARNIAVCALQLATPHTIASFDPLPRASAQQSHRFVCGAGSAPNRCAVPRNTASH